MANNIRNQLVQQIIQNNNLYPPAAPAAPPAPPTPLGALNVMQLRSAEESETVLSRVLRWCAFLGVQNHLQLVSRTALGLGSLGAIYLLIKMRTAANTSIDTTRSALPGVVKALQSMIKIPEYGYEYRNWHPLFVGLRIAADYVKETVVEVAPKLMKAALVTTCGFGVGVCARAANQKLQRLRTMDVENSVHVPGMDLVVPTFIADVNRIDDGFVKRGMELRGDVQVYDNVYDYLIKKFAGFDFDNKPEVKLRYMKEQAVAQFKTVITTVGEFNVVMNTVHVAFQHLSYSQKQSSTYIMSGGVGISTGNF